jgi:hypothetical protein
MTSADEAGFRSDRVCPSDVNKVGDRADQQVSATRRSVRSARSRWRADDDDDDGDDIACSRSNEINEWTASMTDIRIVLWVC